MSKKSRKRRIAGRPMKKLTTVIYLETFSKLEELAGAQSIAATIDKMTAICHKRATERLERKNTRISADSPCTVLSAVPD